MAEIIDTFAEMGVVDPEAIDGPVEIVISGVDENEPELIAVEVPGPQGPEGEKGDKGDPGSSSSSYEHVQKFPARIWTVNHGLGYKPNLLVFDEQENLLLGWTIAYESDSVLLLRFNMVQSGKANAS